MCSNIFVWELWVWFFFFVSLRENVILLVVMNVKELFLLFFCVGVELVGEDLVEWLEEVRWWFEELMVGKKLVVKLRGVVNYSCFINEEIKILFEFYDMLKGNEDLLIVDVLVNEGLVRWIKEM